MLPIILIAGCETVYDAKDYREVSIEELVSHPADYRGQKVRTSGYLVAFDGVQLLDPRSTYCRGGLGNSDRVYAITTLPPSALGKETQRSGMFEPAFTSEGRLVVVIGIFEGSTTPWPKNSIFDDPPPFPAAGPIKKARIVEMTDKTCDFRNASGKEAFGAGSRVRGF